MSGMSGTGRASTLPVRFVQRGLCFNGGSSVVWFLSALIVLLLVCWWRREQLQQQAMTETIKALDKLLSDMRTIERPTHKDDV